MIRIVSLIVLIASMVLSSGAAIAQETEQPSAPGGLGNTRSELDAI